ncbi:MAG: YbjQ family protein [Gammaproteobacteria bacterium]
MSFVSFIDYIFIALLLVVGYGFGQYAERKHYRSIMKREAESANLLVFSAKTPPESFDISSSRLVGGNVVVSVDYFKRFVSGLRALVGGRMKSYETLVDRGRREAILRMKKQAAEFGANMIFNVKLETASISKGNRGSIGSIEVYAYGTAVKSRRSV